ncbi:S24 family peptidase [Pelagibacterium luteolum]|uniref:Phage repressor protein C, contains Cro/C1-type HTH and peptisase s24 domains n=1 Tax=Pelagibacterium luteolum TaxID=440168 RepID=A0A1G7Y4S0_9HYPH|nr:helix-turn-helix transcriptional regulator [Pelagibacterium luteolum]SDG90980.1 Phage repressor protein C, contains Cro/C1-type HTH and peptisase s24 domains [Pelagibacterium luteolum]
MLSHRAIWQALDALAERHGLSTSGLAKLAGLDATAFNPSKRISKDGRERWPSTESIAKVLEATSENFDTLMSAAIPYSQHSTALTPGMTVPLLGFAQAGSGGYFDAAGFPAGQGWDEVKFPGLGDGTAYALEVTGDSMQPLYRDGDYIIVSPTEQLRRGDRVVARTREGEVMAKILYRRTEKQIELHSINPEHEPRIFKPEDIDWIARILWASQ